MDLDRTLTPGFESRMFPYFIVPFIYRLLPEEAFHDSVLLITTRPARLNLLSAGVDEGERIGPAIRTEAVVGISNGASRRWWSVAWHSGIRGNRMPETGDNSDMTRGIRILDCFGNYISRDSVVRRTSLGRRTAAKSTRSKEPTPSSNQHHVMRCLDSDPKVSHEFV